jgi:hypothetical protein
MSDTITVGGVTVSRLPFSGTAPVIGASTEVPPRMVQFRPDPLTIEPVTAWLGDEPARATAGDAQIDREDNPQRTARTVWRGRDPLALQIPVRLDGYGARNPVSVEALIRRLEEMWGRGRRGTPAEPVSLCVDSGGWVPFDSSRQPDLRWWIEGIDWDAETLRRADGHRVRQLGTIQLVQVVRGQTRLKASSAEKARQALGNRARNTYVARDGDTLSKISTRFYGSTAHALDIARLNGLGVRSTLRAGRTIRLPS